MKIFILFVVFVVDRISTTEIRCPINEEFNECGPACQTNCTRKPDICTLQCVSGCFCRAGFVRQTDEQSPCVPRHECPCRNNEFYNPCGSACPDSCASRSERCTKQCVPGCFCRQGFVLATNSSSSLCIPPNECQNQLCQDPNAEFTDCGPAFPPTCDDEINPIRKFRILPPICHSGCFCKKGFVLDHQNRCVRPETCCSIINGFYSKCSSACPQTCRTKKNVFCPFPCASGCFCAEDFVRRDSQSNSSCVSISSCHSF